MNKCKAPNCGNIVDYQNFCKKHCFLTDGNKSEQHELFDFAYDVYYKAISLIKLNDGTNAINIDDEILKDVIKDYLTKHSECLRGNES